MSSSDFNLLLEKFIEGKCSLSELEQILKWYRRLIDETKIELSDVEKIELENQIWQSVKQQTVDSEAVFTEEENDRNSRIFKIFSKVAIAACIVFLLGFGFYMIQHKNGINSQRKVSEKSFTAFGNLSIPSSYTYSYNKSSAKKILKLADGSIVTLNPGAVLAFPNTFDKNIREVFLSGNAFFNIFHNPAKHFIIHTRKNFVAEVLGTSFSISENDNSNNIKLSVTTGAVSVYEEKKTKRQKHDEIIVTRNQMVEFDETRKKFTTSLVDEPENLIADNSSNFSFDDKPLSYVIEKLNSGYGINIEAENKNILDCLFSGDIADKGLFAKLELICQTLNLSYEINGTRIILKGNSCEN